MLLSSFLPGNIENTVHREKFSGVSYEIVKMAVPLDKDVATTIDLTSIVLSQRI